MKRMFVVLVCSLVLTGFSLATVQAAPVIPKDNMQDLIKTRSKLVDVLQRNANLCKKAVKEVNAYHKKHIKEFKRKKAATKKFVERLSPAQRKAYGKRMAPQAMKLFKKTMKVNSLFHKKCPKLSKRLTKVFEDFSLK